MRHKLKRFLIASLALACLCTFPSAGLAQSASESRAFNAAVEEFEDALDSSSNRDERKIAGKLLKFAEQLAIDGPQTGGGYAEKCRNYDFWQLKASTGNRRGREFFGFDGDRAVLLSGVVKGPREATPAAAYFEAQRYWTEYKKTRQVSPEQEEGS